MLTVLMPVINPHPVFFPEAVRSVLNQTYPHFELLIVEDPSDQSAGALLERIPDPRIRHLRNPNRTSFLLQLNQGLREARFDLVARMDADDIACPDRLRMQSAFLHANPAIDVLGGQLHVIDHDGKPVGMRRYPLDHDSILRTMPIYNPLAHPTVMYRRAKVLQAGGYQHERCNEDYELWSRLAHAGFRFANLPEPLIHYRIHQEGMKSDKLRETIRGTLEVKRKYWFNQMGLRGRLRMLGERALLLLPPRLVLKLFMAMYYRRGN